MVAIGGSFALLIQMTLEGFITSLFNDLNSLLKSYNPSNKVDFWVLRRWPTKKPKGTPFPFLKVKLWPIRVSP